MNQSINVFCPDHKLQIQFIDINQKTPLGKRAQCSKCELLRPKPIQEALDIGMEAKQKEQIIINQYKEATNNSLFGLRKQLIEFNALINKQVEQMIGYIDQLVNEVFKELQSIQKWSMNFDQITSLRDLQHIGQNISQMNQRSRDNPFQKIDDRLKDFKAEQKQGVLKRIIQLLEELGFKDDIQQLTYKSVGKIGIDEGKLALGSSKNIVALGLQNTLKIYNFQDNIIQIQQEIQFDEELTSLCFENTTDTQIVLGLDNGNLQICMLQVEQWSKQQLLIGHASTITCIKFPSPEFLITSSFDKTIIVWSFKQEWTINQKLECHFGQVNCLSLSENQLLASGSDDKQIVIWQQNQNKQWKMKQAIQRAHDNYVDSVCFISNTQLASQSQNGEFKIWKINKLEFEQQQLITLNKSKYGHYYYHSLNFNQKLNLLYCHRCSDIIVYKLNNQKMIVKQQVLAEGGVYCGFGVSNTGQYLVIHDEKSEQMELYQLK